MNVLASGSFTPGSPWALGIVTTPRGKDSGSNLALRRAQNTTTKLTLGYGVQLCVAVENCSKIH